MSKLTFKEWSVLSDLQIIDSINEDFEFSMARGELKTAQDAVKRLMDKLKGEGDLEAWVQSKITKAAEYLDTVADHLSHGEDDTVRTKEVKEGFKGHKSVEEIAKKHKVSPSFIEKQLEMGMKVEHEHTTDNDQAMDIALQHLDEIPNYYSKLKKVEKVKEDWSEKYKKSIDCNNPKGFSQRAHCQGRKKKVEESVEIHDANGNLFATVVDIIKGSDYKFKSFTQPEDSINENKSGDDSLHDWFTKSRASDGTPGWVQLGGKYAGKPCAKQPGQTTKPKCGSSKMKAELSDKEEESAFRRKNQEDPNPDRKGKAKMVATEEKDACYSKVKSRYKVWPSAYASGALVKCRKVGAKNWGNKTKKESFELQEMGEVQRYCPKCQKNETGNECKYGEGYWRMFSLPSSLAPEQPYSIAKVHPANEQVSFDIGVGHRQAQRQAKIRNLATGTTNAGEKAAAKSKLTGPSLPLADSVIQPGQLATEDYQRIQSTGNVYTILFSWRGRPMMNLQLFFATAKRPSKDEVKAQIEKFYPGAIIMQWYPSPTDPSKPIVVIQR
jgi:hypothetical protein